MRVRGLGAVACFSWLMIQLESFTAKVQYAPKLGLGVGSSYPFMAPVF